MLAQQLVKVQQYAIVIIIIPIIIMGLLSFINSSVATNTK